MKLEWILQLQQNWIPEEISLVQIVSVKMAKNRSIWLKVSNHLAPLCKSNRDGELWSFMQQLWYKCIEHSPLQSKSLRNQKTKFLPFEAPPSRIGSQWFQPFPSFQLFLNIWPCYLINIYRLMRESSRWPVEGAKSMIFLKLVILTHIIFLTWVVLVIHPK